jgi:hypothetical protein
MPLSKWTQCSNQRICLATGDEDNPLEVSGKGKAADSLCWFSDQNLCTFKADRQKTIQIVSEILIFNGPYFCGRKMGEKECTLRPKPSQIMRVAPVNGAPAERSAAQGAWAISGLLE